MDYDFGRHLTMLPSRGLRPTQLAPLASRQSTLRCSNTARKVRLPRVVASSLQPTSALPLPYLCPTSASAFASACRRLTWADTGLPAPTYASQLS